MLEIKRILSEIEDVSEILDENFRKDISNYINTLMNPDEQAFVFMKKKELLKNKPKYDEFESALLDKWLFELGDFKLNKPGLFDGSFFYTFDELIKLKFLILDDKGRVKFFNKGLRGRLVLSGEVQNIENTVFNACSIDEIVLSDNMIIIPDYCFTLCSNLKRVEFGCDTRAIGEGAFSYTGLEQIDIPSGISIISKGAFSYCPNLVRGSISYDLEYIDSKVFFGTGFRSIGKMNKYTDKESHLYISDSVKEIRESAFAECDNLFMANIPFVKGISRTAFRGCNLEDENVLISPSCYIY